MDKIELGATPVEEKCAQLNVTPDYSEIARAECAVYRRQLLRLYKAAHNGNDLPEGCSLKTTSNPHDAGTYHEVAVRFNESYELAVNAAFWFDANCPSHWDDEAKKELEELIPSPNASQSPRDNG